MSGYTDDAINAKLASLNETTESIVSVSQWILFYRKNAERTAQVWTQKINTCHSSKKLPLIYVANEVVQQSRIKKKEEFIRAFEPLIAEATVTAFKTATPSSAQEKIRRVVDVWRDRQIFRPDILQQIDAGMASRAPSRKQALGGSLYANASVPPELASVAPLATTLQKADSSTKPAVDEANRDYEKLTNPNNAIPTPPVHAAGLATLVKKLATAEGAVAESIKARQALISGLEKLLDTNKAKLSAEEAQVAELRARKSAIEGRKREVEEAILKGLSVEDQHAISAAPLSVSGGFGTNAESSLQRPNIEALTPPPVESFTPVGSPQPFVPNDVLPEPAAEPIEPIAVPAPPGTTATSTAPVTGIGSPKPPQDVDLSAKITQATPAGDGMNGAVEYHDRSAKKRKLSRSLGEDEMAAFEGDNEIQGLDERMGSLI
ncbi:DUF618-domain-containing protein [Westerdykella ornata]|uniref:DUF618-domain-containing protein n=1 Tax=Westerdykella ornata TaxID=318751 RepID=A0A6A6JTS9_WESOR|nr:DUF618-domain-containing protein [Westerdykella ornata]KAF2279644.1 DUF618-domain-containing protein [Westerdykella ornata]